MQRPSFGCPIPGIPPQGMCKADHGISTPPAPGHFFDFQPVPNFLRHTYTYIYMLKSVTFDERL